MSIDKFGRFGDSSHSTLKQGPRGEGFSLTVDGNYDMCMRRLCNVGEAKVDTDAVNLKQMRDDVDKQLTKTLTEVDNRIGFSKSKTGDYNFKKRRLCNVGDAVDETDATNLKRIRKMNDERDQQLSAQLTEAINKVVVDVNNKVTFSKTTDGDYNFKKQRLSNIADAKENGDAVTFGMVKRMFEEYNSSLRSEIKQVRGVQENEVEKYYETLRYRLDRLEAK